MRSKAFKALISVTVILLLITTYVTADSVTDPSVTYTYSTTDIGQNTSHHFFRVRSEGSDGSSYEFLTRIPAKVHRALETTMKKQITLINGLAYECPDVNLYVYVPTTLENTALGAELFPDVPINDIYDAFVSGLSDDVNFGMLKYDSIEERNQKFFISDHHWNRYGSYEGYCDIISMMQKNYVDFGEPREIVEDIDFGVRLYGSIAETAETHEIYDDFGVLDLGLPQHKLTRNSSVPYGGKTEFNTLVNLYLNDEYDHSKDYNHFMNFYQIPSKIVYPENNTGRNLLLICDSFSTCVSEAIASHFDTTYVRYVDSVTPPKIEYAKYLEQYQITDVLILQEPARLVTNLYGDSIKNITLYGEPVHTLPQKEPENTNIRGDANGDGKVNSKDISTMMKIIAGWDVDYIRNNSDYNGDGKFNSIDVYSMLVDSSKGIL